MIISHKYKYIFLKTNKTAGTSIEIALSKYCGPDDIITPIAMDDESKRSALGYRGPQNHFAPIGSYGIKDMASRLIKGRRKVRFYNHMPACEIRHYIEDDVWNSYYKFCFERNPWDRVISLYYWLNKEEPRPSFSEFIASDGIQRLKRRGHDVYTIDGTVVVDRICRFESLVDEMESVRQHLGFPEALELPKTKSKHRKDKRSYRDVLGEMDRNSIAGMFSTEIEVMGYEW